MGGEGIEALRSAVLAADPGGSESAIKLWRFTLPHLTGDQLDEAVRRSWMTVDERLAAGGRASCELQGSYGARRILRRLVVATSLGIDPSEVEIEARCSRCGVSGHGRPSMRTPSGSRPWMSTSSAGKHFVIALGPHALGVDIEEHHRMEAISSSLAPRLVSGWRHVAERFQAKSAIEIWTGLEALSKVTGRGLFATEHEIAQAAGDHDLVWMTDPATVICLAVQSGGCASVGAAPTEWLAPALLDPPSSVSGLAG